MLEPQVFWKSMISLSQAEPHTSYRTALSVEAAILNLYETIRTNSTPKQNELGGSSTECSMEATTSVADGAEAADTTKPKTVRRRAAPTKKKT